MILVLMKVSPPLFAGYLIYQLWRKNNKRTVVDEEDITYTPDGTIDLTDFFEKYDRNKNRLR